MTPSMSVLVYCSNNAVETKRLLDSINEQTFQIFEALLLYDPEKTAVSRIVNKYCEKNDNFVPVDVGSAGRSTAFNKGIEKARGDYVLFSYPPFFYTKKAFERFCRIARQENADIAIGGLETEKTGDRIVDPTSAALSKAPAIYPYTTELYEGELLRNRVFLRKRILEEGLVFGDDRAGELLFLLKYIDANRSIAAFHQIVAIDVRDMSCPDIRDLPASDMHISAGDYDRTRRDLESIREILDRWIEEETGDGGEGGIDPDIKDHEEHIRRLEREYNWQRIRSALITRHVDKYLIGEYYRRLWICEESLIPIIRDDFEDCRRVMLESDWQSFESENEDLRLTEGLPMTDDLVESPLVTVCISASVDQSEINDILYMYYDQTFPAFEIIVDEALRPHVDERFAQMRNLSYLASSDPQAFKKGALDKALGEHIMFVDEMIVPGKTAIKEMYDSIGFETFASAPLISDSEAYYGPIRSNQTPYINEYAVQKKRSPYNRLDCVWGNKLFRTNELRRKKILFRKGPSKDVYRLYNNSGYIKLPTVYFYTSLKGSDIIRRSRRAIVSLTYPLKLLSEKRRLHRNELENLAIPAVPLIYRIRRGTNHYIRVLYQQITIKLVYPLLYKIHAMKPIRRGSVLYATIRKTSLPDSMELIYRKLEETDGYSNRIHHLEQIRHRYREKFKVDIAFIKDFATAEYLFIDDAFSIIGGFRKRKDTQVIQLWHGCGAFKKFGWSTMSSRFGADHRQINFYNNLDLVTVSSPEVEWAYEEAMNLKDQGVVRGIGISRTDVFFDGERIAKARDKVYEAVPEAGGRRIILYAPTFRGRTVNASGPDKLDIAALHDKLGDDWCVLIKHHPYVKKLPPLPMEYEGSFVFDVSKRLDIDDLIMAADICISDYSSLIYEVSLLDTPVILYPYDIDIYLNWRGFYYDYYDMAPGPVFMDTGKIADYIADIDNSFDRDKMAAFREKFMASCDGHATDRILKEIGITQ